MKPTTEEVKKQWEEAVAAHRTWMEQRRTIKEINIDEGPLHHFAASVADDPRKGIRAYGEKAAKTEEKLKTEWLRIGQLRQYENRYPGIPVCGIDEVGRGPLAGPVVAAAVILPEDCHMFYINDSKKLTAQTREVLYDRIMEEAVAVGIGCVSHARIDEINILQATYEAMREAISRLDVTPGILLNDAVTIPGVDLPQEPIIHGDAKSISIGAASIVAKVTRDRMMEEYDELFPEYGFASNKGYGSRRHIEALEQYGPTPIHRRTFIGNFIQKGPAGQ